MVKQSTGRSIEPVPLPSNLLARDGQGAVGGSTATSAGTVARWPPTPTLVVVRLDASPGDEMDDRGPNVGAHLGVARPTVTRSPEESSLTPRYPCR